MRFLKPLIIGISLFLAAYLLYAVVFFIGAILPLSLQSGEVRNETIQIEDDGRYLLMDVYTGHSALNMDGVYFKRRKVQLIVRPVYCLIGAPVSLCHPKLPTEYIDRPIKDSYQLVKVKLPETPKTVVLKFRGGITREVNQ